MARYSDDEVLPAVSGICITYMPRIIFDWHDELITSGRIHYLFTYVGSHVVTSSVTETERVIRRFGFVGLQFYMHMSLTSLQYSELRFCN